MLLEINGRATIAIASPEVASLRPPIWQINARPEAHKVTDRQFIAGASRDRQSDPFHAIAYLGHHKPVNAPEQQGGTFNGGGARLQFTSESFLFIFELINPARPSLPVADHLVQCRLKERTAMKCTTALDTSPVRRPAWGAMLVFVSSVLCLGAEPSKTDLPSLPARPAPEWLTHGVMYQITLRSFTPEGTLRAATKRLPSVAELGGTVIYLCPVALSDDDPRQEYWSPRQKASGTNNPRNPYRIKDYGRVDPEYGTEADLRDFVATAHSLNLRVLLDLVYFHCGPTSVLVDKPGFIQRDAAGKFLMGGWNFPRLNFQCRQLREYLWADMEHWVKDFQVDGFRCDVADAVPLDFWEIARERLQKLRPDPVMLSEGQRAADQIKAFDINYGFSWYETTSAVLTRSQPASALRKVWEKQRAERPRGARFIRYTDNHDLANDMRRPDVVFGQRGAHAMSVVNFTLDGIPFLYNGQEIGDTSLHSIYARWPVRWEAACLPTPRKTWDFYRQLCQLRRSRSALHSGDVVWVDHDQPDAVIALLRRAGAEEILSVANLSNRSVRVRLDLPTGTAACRPLLSRGAKAAASAGKMAFDLEGFGYVIAENDSPARGIH